jgi:hypothetical protein
VFFLADRTEMLSFLDIFPPLFVIESCPRLVHDDQAESAVIMILDGIWPESDVGFKTE